MSNDNPTELKPPGHLKAATRRWWESVVSEWDLEDHHVRLLQLAGEAWDRAEDARRAIDKHGLIYTTRFGDPKTRPEVAIERDSRLAFVRILRELDLDVEPPAGARRPPALRSNRG